MEAFTGLCCICVNTVEDGCSLVGRDDNNVQHIKKLLFCAPNETWKEFYQICSPCQTQLDLTYRFLQCCIEGEEFRKGHLEALKEKNSTSDACEEERFICDHCGKGFGQKRYLSQHITRSHVNKKQQKRVKSEGDIQEVEETDTPKLCVEIKPELERVKNENEEVSGGTLGKREPCEIKTDQSDIEDLVNETDFANDDRKQDSSYSDTSEIENEFHKKTKNQSDKTKKAKKEPQKCTFCDETFKKRQDWAAHIRSRHSFEKPFSCDQCDARYMNRYSLLIHSRKHKNEKPFICSTCGKSFVSSADLNHHNKIHNKYRAYPCPMCTRSFKTHSNLRTHRLQMHLDPAEWKFPCNLCDKKFPIRGNLMKHLKRHAGIKEFNCPICDKNFVNKAEMTIHLNTHTNQRLFKCHLCGKDYKNREGLRRHMKVVHDQGNWKAPKAEKKYLCPMCPKIFAFGNKLQRHIFTHTGEKPFKCDFCQKKFIDNYGRKVHYKKDHDIEIYNGN